MDQMLELFIFETFEMIEQLQQLIINSEKAKKFESDAINEIFRIMHTIKGSSGMMMFDNIANVSHTIEDLFYFIRESKPEKIDYLGLTDLVLEGSDLIRTETEKINNFEKADGDFSLFVKKVGEFLETLKKSNKTLNKGKNVETEELKESQKERKDTQEIIHEEENKEEQEILTVKDIDPTINEFSAVLFFQEDCGMENIRCFAVIHKLKEIAEISYFYPNDIEENNDTCEIIKEKGFKIFFSTYFSIEELRKFFMDMVALTKVDIKPFEYENESNIEGESVLNIKEENDKNSVESITNNDVKDKKNTVAKITQKQNLISVDVNKLDKLMDLVGELVISEAMVTKNPDLSGFKLNSFNKAARQHRKRLSDLQDVVMSIRMVSLGPTLNKMNRIVRDMCKKLNKQVELEVIGQETEVDKNIIEHVGDPLMHIIRNSMDHGIETKEERINNGKPSKGKITIEAKNNGGEVWIIVKDDGKGLNREKILNKAIDNGLVRSNVEMLSDKDIYSMIFLPGFSTNENVTEFSGRGVGMDVVIKEIEKIRGTVTIDSIEGRETSILIKIPLTLAIIDGMTIKVGKSAFTIPVTSIIRSIIIKKENIIKDLDNKEMILLREKCYSILRLHELYNIETDIINIEEGIVIVVEDQGKTKCIFADKLIGEQQVVIKTFPEYIKKVNCISGCSLLGDGTISLILNISEIVKL